MHERLLQRARMLARVDPHRPRQANLRGAVSSACYALFHLLVSEAAERFVQHEEMASRIARLYNHGEMRKVCAHFADDRLPRGIRPVGTYTINADVRAVAEAFVRLQDARHLADYDPNRNYHRGGALGNFLLAEQAFEAWGRARRSDDARLLLACFLLWERWDRDPR
ncbi:MAG: hypothetical protein K2W96_02810 [Gemmataceae bacterium]|nr:hypothetical protein [Gemmataceae bacterium]